MEALHGPTAGDRGSLAVCLAIHLVADEEVGPEQVEHLVVTLVLDRLLERDEIWMECAQAADEDQPTRCPVARRPHRLSVTTRRSPVDALPHSPGPATWPSCPGPRRVKPPARHALERGAAGILDQGASSSIWIERQTTDLKVGGSSPSWRTAESWLRPAAC